MRGSRVKTGLQSTILEARRLGSRNCRSFFALVRHIYRHYDCHAIMGMFARLEPRAD
jgi:hypothetical protein